MAPDQASGDYFGRAVSISGNLIGVQSTTADPNGVTNGGSVYLYRLESNGSLSLLNKVIAHDISAEDEFGVDLSLYDNLLLIGSRKADPNGFTNGENYLYRVEQNGSVRSFEEKSLRMISPLTIGLARMFRNTVISPLWVLLVRILEVYHDAGAY